MLQKKPVDVIKSLRASVASPAAVQAFLEESKAGKFSGEEFKAAIDKAANTAVDSSTRGVQPWPVLVSASYFPTWTKHCPGTILSVLTIRDFTNLSSVTPLFSKTWLILTMSLRSMPRGTFGS